MTTSDSTPRVRRRSLLAAGGAVAVSGILGGCAAAHAAGSDGTVAIGYFPNVTHAPGLVADAKGYLGTRLAAVGTAPVVKSFNAGPDVIQAILSGSLDISYIGANPAVTAYVQSKGKGVRVVAGSTSGGASLVVRAGIRGAADLTGKRLASPQLGNTQDVALRFWLKGQGLTATTDGGGQVSVIPQANSAAVQAFKAGSIDGGWLPEPYASSLVRAGGTVLVDERTLWPRGGFVATTVVVRTAFLARRPEAVRAFLDAHLDALDAISRDPADARSAFAAQLKKVTSQAQDPDLLASAWKDLAFDADPLAAALATAAQHADTMGLLPSKPTDSLAKLWSLEQLNAALSARGQAEVSA